MNTGARFFSVPRWLRPTAPAMCLAPALVSIAVGTQPVRADLISLGRAADFAVLGLGASRHGIIPDGGVLRLARLVGLGRAKELALLNDEISPAEARAIGLINWVCAPAQVDAALAGIVERLHHQAPTANAHIKRLLHESFHQDPRAMIEDVMAAQRDCMTSWETTEANQAWREKREATFHPRKTNQ